MGRHFAPFLSFKHMNNLLRVDGKATIWIYCDAEETRVRLKLKQKYFNCFKVIHLRILSKAKLTTVAEGSTN